MKGSHPFLAKLQERMEKKIGVFAFALERAKYIELTKVSNYVTGTNSLVKMSFGRHHLQLGLHRSLIDFDPLANALD